MVKHSLTQNQGNLNQTFSEQENVNQTKKDYLKKLQNDQKAKQKGWKNLKNHILNKALTLGYKYTCPCSHCLAAKNEWTNHNQNSETLLPDDRAIASEGLLWICFFFLLHSFSETCATFRFKTKTNCFKTQSPALSRTWGSLLVFTASYNNIPIFSFLWLAVAIALVLIS